MDIYSFQYCQKIVVFSKDFNKVLLCKRKGEADYDGVYSFIGGKMEHKDVDFLESLKREKNEEVGASFKIRIHPFFTTNALFLKNSGDNMVLPHYIAIYEEGEVILNEEYSDYKWVDLQHIDSFEPKVPTIPDVITKLTVLMPILDMNDFIII